MEVCNSMRSFASRSLVKSAMLLLLTSSVPPPPSPMPLLMLLSMLPCSGMEMLLRDGSLDPACNLTPCLDIGTFLFFEGQLEKLVGREALRSELLKAVNCAF